MEEINQITLVEEYTCVHYDDLINIEPLLHSSFGNTQVYYFKSAPFEKF